MNGTILCTGISLVQLYKQQGFSTTHCAKEIQKRSDEIGA